MPRASADCVTQQLTWVPWDRSLRPPAGLADFEQAWFWNLLQASFFDQTEMQGYLPITSNLWSIAGAKRSDFFESHKSRLLACFEVRKVGGKEVLYYPPLIESMRKQLKRLRTRRSVDSEFSTDSQASTDRAGPFTSTSLFLDFEKEKEAGKKPQLSAKLAERYELERRDGLKRLTRTGLRDYKKHPLEEWEKQTASGD